MNEDRKILSITELNGFIKGTVEGSPYLKRIFVRGEISNLSISNGSAYLTLKDGTSRIKAIIFKSVLSRLPFRPENGLKVIVGGAISLYVPYGEYSITVFSLEPDGIGALAIQYEQLKKKLEAEGLFDPSHKRPLPRYPKRIGVITSPTGAAVRDIINVTGRRFPMAEIVIFPSLVQGEGAEANLIEGIKYFGSGKSSADVIIIGRGGGSIEDLWAFNSEALAREIYKSSVPVISAVGHETDFTICDFVSDRRAPTPSAAAELAVPDTKKLKEQFGNATQRLVDLTIAKISKGRLMLDRYSKSQYLRSPSGYIDGKRIETDTLNMRMRAAIKRITETKRSAYLNRAAVLNAVSPLKTLSKGYTALTDEKGKSVKSVNEVKKGDTLTLTLADGKIKAEAKETVKSSAQEGERNG